MLSAVYAVVVCLCLSVCHTPVLYQNGWLTFTIRPHLETSIFASYYRQQTMLLIYI